MGSEVEAPVRASGTIDVAASQKTVWTLISGVEAWSSWNPDVARAELHGELEPGTEFTWKAGPGIIRSQLTEVTEPSVIAWTGSTMGIKAHHVWELTTTDEGTRVTTHETWDGLLPRLLRSTMTKTLQTAIDKGLRAIKLAAEAETNA